jgi:hypothetical protein
MMVSLFSQALWRASEELAVLADDLLPVLLEGRGQVVGPALLVQRLDQTTEQTLLLDAGHNSAGQHSLQMRKKQASSVF